MGFFKALFSVFLPEQPQPTRNPTPDETREAKASLQIVLNEIDASEKAYKTKHGALAALTCLTDAAYHLRAIRKLDPSVTITRELESGPFTMTVDYLAAEIFFHESWAHRANNDRKKSLRAAERAVQYEPNNVSFLQQLARCQGDKLRGIPSAIQTLKKARALDPDNLETIKLQREMTRPW